MDRRLTLAAACLALMVGIAACQPVDGGAGDTQSPQASAAESTAAPAVSATPEETPIASMGSDYGY